MPDITQIIIENQNLIYSIASKFNGYSSSDDLFQVGCLGMIEAYNNYDPNKGTKFTSYAYPYILGAMSNYIREDNTVKLSREISRYKRQIENARGELTQILMRFPTNKEISNYLNISLDDLEKILSFQNECESLDEPFHDELSLYEVIGEAKDYDTLIALKEELEELNEPERTIMYKRYFEDVTQTKLAEDLGMSQVDISRREHKVLVKLKKNFN